MLVYLAAIFLKWVFKKHEVSPMLSDMEHRSFVTNNPAAENALSDSMEETGDVRLAASMSCNYQIFPRFCQIVWILQCTHWPINVHYGDGDFDSLGMVRVWGSQQWRNYGGGHVPPYITTIPPGCPHMKSVEAPKNKLAFLGAPPENLAPPPALETPQLRHWL